MQHEYTMHVTMMMELHGPRRYLCMHATLGLLFCMHALWPAAHHVAHTCGRWAPAVRAVPGPPVLPHTGADDAPGRVVVEGLCACAHVPRCACHAGRPRNGEATTFALRACMMLTTTIAGWPMAIAAVCVICDLP